MSAIGGIYNFDDAPVDGQLLAALSQALTAQAPDGGDETQSGSLGMVYQAFHTNLDSWLERQPLISPNGCLLTWDGRLDNREELLERLRDGLAGRQTDAEIVMAAYQQWGFDWLPKLVGDFALSLWDPLAQSLLLARDAFGTRPLYYSANEKKIVWSSGLGSLLDLIGTQMEVDEEYVASYFVNLIEPRKTPYKNIYAVEPGTVVTVRHHHLQARRFWAPDPGCEIRYSQDAQYEEHFRELFGEAVRCRLRARGPVWAELSGGLDSSSIVCMADQILSQHAVETSGIKTVSYVYDQSTTSDEREFITCLEQARGAPGVHFQHDDQLLRFQTNGDVPVVRPNPLSCAAARYRQLAERMQSEGARVILSGMCGDNLLWSSGEFSPELADLLVQAKLLELRHRTKHWSRAARRPFHQALWRGAVLPILPQRAQRGFRRLPAIFKLLDPAYISRMNLRERLYDPPDIFGYKLPSGRAQAIKLIIGVSVLSRCYSRELTNIEFCYPYLHRPLVEFLLSIPFEQKLRPGETRSLHRRAMRHLLPEKIAAREGKRGPSEAICRALTYQRMEVEASFAEALVCARKYVSAQSLSEALVKARHGIKDVADALATTLILELWLKSLNCRHPVIRNESIARSAQKEWQLAGKSRAI